MGKKQAQFRFEEKLYFDINEIAEQQGMTVSELVRNAIKLYIAIYDRTKEKNTKIYIENNNPTDNERCELVLPWLL